MIDKQESNKKSQNDDDGGMSFEDITSNGKLRRERSQKMQEQHNNGQLAGTFIEKSKSNIEGINNSISIKQE
jgi:hypothetical protein